MTTVGLDPEWIAAQLAHNGSAPGHVEFGGFIGTGQMSRTCRYSLTWPDGGSAPTSIVVKLPSADDSTRSMSFEHGAYASECGFYDSIAPLVDVAVPRAHRVYYDQAAEDFAILLDDLTGSEQGDQFSEPSSEQLALAIEQSAALQAPVWGQTAGEEFGFLHTDVDERAAGMELLLPAFLAAVFERLGEGIDPDVADLLDRFQHLAGAWTRARSTPTTLVHGDFRPDNFMFGIEPGAPPLVVVDWQTLGLGLGATDLAYLLGGALEPSRRREVEDDLIEEYIDELSRRGVDYSSDQCRGDYALGSLHGVVVAITATTVAEQTERGDALFTLMLNRHGRHALDLGALDLLDA